RRLVLLLAALALGALTVLAVSLNGVPFHEAQHFVRPEPEVIQPPDTSLPPIQIEIPLWKQLVTLGLLLLLVALVMLLLSPQMRKRMFLLLIRGLFTVWAVYFLIKKYGDQLFGFNLSGNKGPQPGNDLSSPMPVFEPPQAASTFSYAISFVFALLLLALLWALYRSWQRYIALTSPGKSLDDIARIARSSLDDLSSGRNSSDVIINCYLRMNDVVSSKRKLNREIAMTPREFALRLEEAGLPGEAVTQLTRLFEGVRYGDRKSAPRDVNEAVNCLKTILHYCGEPA
ncbi:MAG TPA: DUF4129 domain-containing protein, partial [Anaerolineales bacterium]|nr:DUF4129 domain-containing protein [Anaerolineales bacterium]